MSSANEVKISIIEESVYDETPAAGNFLQPRFSSETLDATPDAVKNPEIRSDRQSGGTKVLKIATGGGLNNLFVRDAANDLLIGCAMYDTINAKTAMAADTITVDATAKTLVFTAENPSSTFAVGDLCKLSGMASSLNNTNVVVTVIDATTITYVGGELMINASDAGAIATHPAYYEIGKDRRSISIEKEYTDLTDLFVNYTGERVDTMAINLAHGSYAELNFTLAGASADANITAGDEMTNTRTVNAASTNEPMNSTSDVDLVMIDNIALPCGSSSLSVTVANAHTESVKIGKLEACDQRAGGATVTVAATIELNDSSATWLKDKLTMTAKTIWSSLSDVNGLGYAIKIVAAQLTTSDPSASGQDAQTTMELTGEAKVGDGGENQLRIYALGTLV